MATTLYFRDFFTTSGRADTHRGTNTPRLAGGGYGWINGGLSLARGASATFVNGNSVSGPTDGIEVHSTIDGFDWISPPLAVDVTISGTITFNIRFSESDMMANIGPQVLLEVIRADDLTTDDSNKLETIVNSEYGTEAGTSEGANNWTASPTSTVVRKGDRLRARVLGNDAGGTMGTGYTFSFYFDGPTGGASGDSFITFTETFSFAADPGGTIVYLTDTASSVDVGMVEKEAWTSRGESVTTAVRNTAAGWTAPLQWTTAPPISITTDSLSSTTENRIDLANDRSAQSFFSGIILVLDAIDLYLFKVGSPSDSVVVEIQSDSSGSPSGTVLASASLTGAAIIDSTRNTFTFASPPTLSASTTYWVVVRRSGGDDISNYCQTAGATASVYPNGLAKYSLTGGSTWVTSVSIPDLNLALVSSSFGPIEWYTKPLQAFTLGDKAKGNIRLSGNSALAASARCDISRVDGDGTNPTLWGSWCLALRDNTGGKLGDAETIETFWISGDDLSISNGQRLRIRVYLEDESDDAISAAAFTASVYYNGPTADASGDSWIQLPQNILELIPIPILIMAPRFFI